MGYFHAEALSVCSPLDALPGILPALDQGPILSADHQAVAPEAQRTRQTFRMPDCRVQPTFAAPKCSGVNHSDAACAQLKGNFKLRNGGSKMNRREDVFTEGHEDNEDRAILRYHRRLL